LKLNFSSAKSAIIRNQLAKRPLHYSIKMSLSRSSVSETDAPSMSQYMR